ncbi:(2Fe-2S) ferredoxin domain-containing protein [Streptomyces sp. NPDC127084]|uniref:(2Fe-2S) ferredoxin domain-containing protein n=1 Tax=Streptomyces sp. NPDC127084 TaxID=3347133 RepID=UPI00365541FE
MPALEPPIARAAGVVAPRAARPCTLVVCRGCCCGDPRKNPGTDHEAQVRRLREAAAASAGRFAVRTSECLGPCGQANVVVVQPSSAARSRGARPVWLGWVLDDEATREVLDWLHAGGPGLAEPSATLALQLITPPAARPRAAR